MKKLIDRRMVGFIIIEFLMFFAIAQVEDQVQKASVITMFYNISLAAFTVLVGGNVIQSIKGKNESST